MSENDYLKARLREAIQDGLPLTPRPFLSLAEMLGTTEDTVIKLIRAFREEGLIKRMGVVVRHRSLGYDANAMVVWNVPDAQVDELGCKFRELEHVTLCYRRPRRLPEWPYNLFCMIHGRDRQTVLEQIDAMVERFSLHHIDRDVLFSTHCFKQSGGQYARSDCLPSDMRATNHG